MLHRYLNGAISVLSQLIEITKLDIEDISRARNEEIFARVPLKEDLIKQFYIQKDSLAQEISLMKKKSPNSQLSELIDQDTQCLLDSMRDNLALLKELNSAYGKSAYAVSEFYTSLLKKIVPHESVGYTHSKPQASFLKIQV